MSETPGNHQEFFDRMSVEVPVDEWDSLQGEGVIGTEGLGPCVGVSVYSPEERVAYVGHLGSATASHVTADIDAFMAAVQQGLTVTEGLRVWLGGAEPLDRSDTSTSLAQQEILDRMNQLLGENNQVNVRWSELGENTSYAIDVATGQEVVDVQRDDDDRVDGSPYDNWQGDREEFDS